jgi:thermitase
MSRYKYLLYIALALAVVLAGAFGLQLKKLQKQVRSSVRIIPADSKSRAEVAPNGLDQNGGARPRPQLLVKFRAGVSSETISQITTRFNDQIEDEIEAVPGLTAIQDQDNADAETAAVQYQALTEVEYAEPNYEISVDQDNAGKMPASNDPESHEQWAFPAASVPQAWAKTRGSREIVVAVLDSGVEYTHVNLVNNIWTRPANIKPYQDQDLGTIDDVHGYNAAGNDGDPRDENGHGTACAGIIGAECDNNDSGVCGVNSKTQIMSLKFLNGGGFGYVVGAVAAINYAIDRKRAGVNLRVINASWGLHQPSRALEDVIRAAADEEILFVVAGGDTNTNNDTRPRYPGGYPSGNIINVAAVDSRDALAEFSNYGLKTVQLAAPGKDLLTTTLGNDHKRLSGTSLAAAFVSGVAALALSAHPELSMDQLRSLLLQAVDQRAELRGRVTTGGRINAARALGP